MKTLYLVRHAKSDRNIPYLKDIARPLNERGLNDAKLISQQLADRKIKPDLIISSTAERAQTTAKIFCNNLNSDEEKIIFNKNIYYSDVETLLSEIKNISDEYEKVMIIGHNPTMTSFINFITCKYFEHLHTSGVAVINIDLPKWADVKGSSGKPDFYIYPKMFKG